MKNYNLLEILIQNGIDLNSRDKLGWGLLHYAAQNTLIEIGNLLISNGANLEIEDSYGNTPLWRAVFESKGRGEFIHLLLSAGADRNKPNKSNITPYDLANNIANFDVKQFFLTNL